MVKGRRDGAGLGVQCRSNKLGRALRNEGKARITQGDGRVDWATGGVVQNIW